MAAKPADLSRLVYNVAAFSISAVDLKKNISKYFNGMKICFKIDEKRQSIIDQWPAAVDDSAARRDWGFAPQHDLSSAFEDYLIPRIKQFYTKN